jgi:hypothetical protein
MHSPIQDIPKIKPMNFSELKPIGADSVPTKRQSLKEWAMAGGGVPTSHKGREHVWHGKVHKMAAGGEVYNTNPDMSDGGEIIQGAAFAKGGEVKKDDEGAAFGVFPQAKAKRSKQDREASKNVPVDLARGAVAGALGAPGDIEALIRMLPYLDEKTVLPTSEEIEQRLPFRSESPVSKAAAGLGSLAGGFYTGPGAPIRLAGALPSAVKRAGQDFAMASAAGVPHVIKPKGGNWFGNRAEKELNTLKKNKMAGENLEEMKQVYPPDVLATMSPETRVSVDRAFPHLEKEAALNNWVDRNLTNYVKKEMATPEDPVRKLAEQNITHYPVAEDPGYWSRHGRTAREDFGGTEMANSPLAKQWENRTDAMIMKDTAQQHQDMMHLSPGMYSDKDEWIKKLAPDTPLYSAQQNRFSTLDLGFDHIMDVLREDLAAGRIRPEQLSKVSITDAVRRTHQYDQELAKKMAEAKATAREGLPVHKEYPEGYKWVELNKPGSFASESDAMGHSVRGYEPPKGHPDWTEGSGDSGSSGYGHGGWEAIKSGKAKVYSLVDPKGASHATVEVGPTHRDRGFFGNQRPTGDDYYSQQNKYIAGQNDGTVSPQLTFAEWWRSTQGIPEPEALPPRISQIKGKSNRAPNEEYLPYVQDFVKSGQWSDVGDLHNTNLIPLQSDSELAQKIKRAGEVPPHYLTQNELTEYAKKYNDGMAEGGDVHMSGGGAAIKAALAKLGKFASEVDLASIKEAGRIAHEQEAFIRAAKNADIEKRLQAMPARSKAANIEMGLYHPVGGGAKLAKPFEAMHSTRVPNPKVKTPDVKILTPEDLFRERATFYPLVGDKADTGTFLTHIGEKELEVPVGLGGGPRYMDVNYHPEDPTRSAAWESGTGRVTSLGSQAKRAGESGNPVYGVYTAGSGTNTDFNVMGTNAVLQQLPQSKFTKKTEKAFDSEMRSIYPDWPGVRNEAAADLLMDKGQGELRKSFLTLMGSEPYQKAGLPDIPATRKAIMDPQLYDVPTNESGFRIARMDPTGRIVEDPLHPSDYPTAMAGELAGQLNQGVDYKDMFSTHFANRRLLSQPESGDYYSFSRAHPIQYADQEWLDKIMKAQEQKDKLIKTGKYAKGGLAAAKRKATTE